jgi:hypothetical protein
LWIICGFVFHRGIKNNHSLYSGRRSTPKVHTQIERQIQNHR